MEGAGLGAKARTQESTNGQDTMSLHLPVQGSGRQARHRGRQEPGRGRQGPRPRRVHAEELKAVPIQGRRPGLPRQRKPTRPGGGTASPPAREQAADHGARLPASERVNCAAAVFRRIPPRTWSSSTPRPYHQARRRYHPPMRILRRLIRLRLRLHLRDLRPEPLSRRRSMDRLGEFLHSGRVKGPPFSLGPCQGSSRVGQPHASVSAIQPISWLRP